MDAQVLNEGRHQGGRTPYGYTVMDGGPHPNPRKESEGYRLRVLAIDDDAAEVVRRIFAEYVGGKGDRTIAGGLNRDGVPCPSAQRPRQNRHRIADGWQASTIRAILENPRYTGYAFFGRWTRQETLLDPDDVAAGNVIRFRRSSPDQIVRSRQPAHPEIVPVEQFTQAQLLRRSRAAGGNRGIAKLERTRNSGARAYALRGLLRCACCGRRMHGAIIRKTKAYYRCLARSLAPGSEALAEHPRTVNVPELDVVEPLNRWVGGLFARENLDQTVEALLSSQNDSERNAPAKEAAKQRLAEAQERLSRFQAAVAAGADPAALVEPINEAQADRAAAQAELDRAPETTRIGKAEVHAMIDSLGDVGSALKNAEPGKLNQLYNSLGMELIYKPHAGTVEATISPRVVSACVGGGSCALSTRIELPGL